MADDWQPIDDWQPVGGKAAPQQPTQSLFNNPLLTGIKAATEPIATGVQGIGDLMGAGMRAVGIPTRDTSQPLPHNVTVPGEMMGPGTVPDDTYKPTSFGGKVVEGIGQFAPSAGLGPEGILPKAASVVFPALGSETVGSVTTNPYARALGGVAGAGVGGLATRGVTALAGALRGGAEAIPSAVDAVAPTIRALKQTSQDAYNAVFNDPAKNVIISKDALGGLADQVKKLASDFGYKPQLNPKAATVINDVLNLPDENSTLAGLETTRRLASNVARDYGTSDGALASQIRAKITDFMSNLGDKDIVGTQAGGPTDLSGVDFLNDARQNWATMRKAEIIQKIEDDAQIRGAANYTQAGVDTAIRRGAANLATNKAKMAQFTPDEQDAIKQVATGDLPTNILRGIGKFAVRGPVSGMATHVVGNLLGPAGPYMLAGAAEAAKAGAASGTQANMDALQALIRGGPEAQAALSANRRAALVNGLGKYAPALAGATALAPSVYGGQ